MSSQLFRTVLSVALAVGLALLALVCLVRMEEKGLLVLSALCVFPLVLAAVWRFENVAVPVAFGLLLVMPFFLGVSRTPKVFLDEILPLLLLMTVCMKVFSHTQPLRLTPQDIFIVLFALVLYGFTMAFTKPNYVAFRTFLETFGLGTLLMLICAQVSSFLIVRRTVYILGICIAVLSAAGILEFFFTYNPLLTYAAKAFPEEGIIVLTPELIAQVGGLYRPYVTSFHPSEAATLVALCLPFFIAFLSDKKLTWLYASALVLGIGFIIVNSTRGVWLACLVTAFIFIQPFRKMTFIALPFVVIAVAILVMFLGDQPFVERLTDPRNLFIRFFYWDIGLEHFFNNSFLGVGYYNFQNVYLDYSPFIPADIQADVEQIATIDNMYLMILIEQGLVGLTGLGVLLFFIFRRLRQADSKLQFAADPALSVMAKAGLATVMIYCICGLLVDVHLFYKATKLCLMLVGLCCGLALSSGDKTHGTDTR